MAPQTVLASDVMDSSAALLNDAARDLYTDAVQLPYLKMANEELEQILVSFGIDVQSKASASIPIAVGDPTVVDLPDDFFLPQHLYERADGATEEADWVPMKEKDSLTGHAPANTISFWNFENNTIYIVPPTVAREVKLEYVRYLSIITSENSPIDNGKFKRYLSRKTAELCARYIGRNSVDADELLTREVNPAEDDIVTILVKNMQGARKRRMKFNGPRALGVMIR